MAPNLTLYMANGSCSTAAHTLLKELELPFKAVTMVGGPNGIQSADGTIDGTTYKKNIHHAGYVPALQVDDAVITEGPAIVSYIADLVPDRKLNGSDPLTRAKILEWLVWMSGTLHGVAFAALYKPARFADDQSAHPAITEKGKKSVEQCFETIEKALTGVHAVGNHLTLVDLYLHVYYRWGHRFDMGLKDKYPKYSELVKEVEKLKSMQEVIKEEGLTPMFP